MQKKRYYTHQTILQEIRDAEAAALKHFTLAEYYEDIAKGHAREGRSWAWEDFMKKSDNERNAGERIVNVKLQRLKQKHGEIRTMQLPGMETQDGIPE